MAEEGLAAVVRRELADIRVPRRGETRMREDMPRRPERRTARGVEHAPGVHVRLSPQINRIRSRSIGANYDLRKNDHSLRPRCGYKTAIGAEHSGGSLSARRTVPAPAWRVGRSEETPSELQS